jgi:hypothetical protein
LEGALLHGNFEENQGPVYMEVTEGYDKWYNPKIYVLLLLQTLYGLKRAAKAFLGATAESVQTHGVQQKQG